MKTHNLYNSNHEQKVQVLGFLCRHLVALCLTYRTINQTAKTGELNFFTCPGTIICIRGNYFFLTAGHTLEKIDSSLRKEQISIQNASLADIFSSNVKFINPIPFDLANEKRYFINDDEEGLDFGLIALRSYYIQLLIQNGIAAIFENNWIHQHEIKFDNYIMLGLPAEFVPKTITDLAEDSTQMVPISPTLICVKRLDKSPENIKNTRYPRFIGQLDHKLQLSSIDGMSGGPIFGFYSNFHKYQIVAIQSSWLPDRRITFGCPLPILADLISKSIDRDNDD